MIRLVSLSKSFRGKPALENLSLEISRGEIFGLLGHNGAGKSTTFGLTLGHLHPDSGEAWLCGHNVQQDRAAALRRVGAIYEAPAFYDYLSGWHNLHFYVSLTGPADPQRVKDVIRLVGLEKRIHDPVRAYSHGMRQRLALAQALLPDPEMILLDEPTEGLDPEGIHEMRELIVRLRNEHGLTVLLSSHLLSEIELLCDRVAILKGGKMIFCGAWREAADTGPQYRLDMENPTAAQEVLTRFGVIHNPDGTITLPEGVAVADLVDALVRAGVRLREFARCHTTLEDFYLRQNPS